MAPAVHEVLGVSAAEFDVVEVEGGINVPFKWRDDTPGGSNLGHAEFQVCLKFRRGAPAEFWVYPAQQRDVHTAWHKDWVHPDLGFGFSSYEGLDDPRVWKVGWCPEHKCCSMRLYVPKDSRFIRIDGYGVSFWRSDFP